MFKKAILVTSNQNKIREFQKLVPDIKIEEGSDIKEVLGNMDEVIIHKSKDKGENYLVEDSILLINGEEVVDIKWKMNELKEGDKVTWIVSLGYNNGDCIYIFRGVIEGTITLNGNIGFGFDSYFIPVDCKEGLSLAELDILGKKEEFSARKLALQNFIDIKLEIPPVKIESIPKWTGKYQNE